MSDIYEANNTLETSTNLGFIQGTKQLQASIDTKDDQDFFQFQIGKTANIGDLVSIDFDDNNGLGNLDLYLFTSANSEPIRQSVTRNNSEIIDLNGLAAGVYTAKVVGNEGATGNYSLSLTTPELTFAADPIEAAGNDSFAVAETINPAETRLERTISPNGDQDYYKFDLTSTGLASNYVSLQFKPSQGNLSLNLFDANQQIVASSSNTTELAGNTQISLANFAAGTYYASVAGDTNKYTLNLDTPQAGGGKDAWTVMTYITASDLEQFAPKNIEQMEVMVGKVPTTVNFSTLWDQSAAINNPQRLLMRYLTPGQPAWGDV